MEKVTGIGGVFIRANDPEALGSWYERHLGVSQPPRTYDESPWTQESGPTVFAAMPQDSGHLGQAGWSLLTDPEGNPIQLWQPTESR